MSARLDAYLALERAMLGLDEANDPLADHLRDMMDPIGYSLSDHELALLDGRGLVSLATLHPIRCPVGPSFRRQPSLGSRPEGAMIRDRTIGLKAVLTPRSVA